MKRSAPLLPLLFALAGLLVATTAEAQQATLPPNPRLGPLYNAAILDQESKWTVNNVHDPAIFQDGDTYWVYSTDVAVGIPLVAGIQIRSSKDLIHWKWEGRAFAGVPTAAKAWTDASSLWAPDIVKIGKKYYLYYAASILYSKKSAIGLATADRPQGPFTDQGLIIRSDESSDPNAIDPNPFRDASGGLWMSYGSFAAGLYVVKLDPATGKPVGDLPGTLVARRSEGGALGAEAPYVIYNPDTKKYYLFVSYDSLFSDYNVRVGRSDSPEGPYLDPLGHEMTDVDFEVPRTEIGQKLIGGYSFRSGEGWLAPGHNSVLHDGDRWFLVHHARGTTDKNWPFLQIRTLVWSDDGWPMVSPERYAGEKEGPVAASFLPGNWEVLEIERSSWEDPKAVNVRLEADGSFTGALGTGTWKLIGDRSLQIDFVWARNGEPRTLKARLLPAWDWETNSAAWVWTGLDQEWQVWWGKQVKRVR